MSPHTESPNLRRRHALKLGLSSIAAIALGLPARAREDAKESSSFKFAVVNDLHLLDEGCVNFFTRVVGRINQQKTDLCLIVGDLTEHGSKRQNGTIKDVLKGLKVPTYYVPGNHDFDESGSRKGYDDAFPQMVNYRFEHGGYQFLGLDTTQGRAGSNTVISKSTLDFTAAAITQLDKKKPLVVFTHFPLGFLMPSRPKNANDLLALLAEHNVQAVFNGHFHSSTQRAWAGTTITTNTCCSFRKANHDFDWRKGYFLCTAHEGSVEREYVLMNGEDKNPQK